MPLGDVLRGPVDPNLQLIQIGDQFYMVPRPINTALPTRQLPDATQLLQKYLRNPVHTSGARS